MGKQRASKLTKLKAVAGKTIKVSKRRRKESQTDAVHPGPAVARYLFSSKHAFVLNILYECEPVTSAYLLARACRLSPDLVNFILADLATAKLVQREGALFRPTPLERVNQWIKRFPDTNLRTAAAEYAAWKKENRR